MKRIFIVFCLLFVLGVSAPFASASGADSFDKNSTLQDNIASWLEGSKNGYFPFDGFNSDGYFDIALIYLNDELGFTITGGMSLDNGFAAVKSTQLPADAADLLSYFFTSPVSVDSVSYYMLAGKETISYEWNGSLIDVVPGSLFIGFTLGGDYAGMDVVLLLKPAPAPTPVPAAVWLLGSGIAGLGLLRRKLA